MRTTLTIDDDILDRAKRLAAARGSTIGEVISDLARRALAAPADAQVTRNGIVLFPVQPASGVVSMELVNELLHDTE